MGAGRGGNSNWTGPDVEQPIRVVVTAVQQALDQAGLSGADGPIYLTFIQEGMTP